MSTHTQILRRLSFKVVSLPELTASARASGDLSEGEELVVRVRRVLAKEVAVAAGTMPQLYALAGEVQPGETPEEMRQRLLLRTLEDPELMLAVRERDLQLTRAVVALAVTAYGTRDALEDMRFSADPDAELTVDLLGHDLEHVYLEVMQFSNATSAVGDRTESFRNDTGGDPDQSGGGVLRDDPEPVPEQADS